MPCLPFSLIMELCLCGLIPVLRQAPSTHTLQHLLFSALAHVQ